MQPIAYLRGLLDGALTLVLPPRCLGCGVIVGSAGTLCPACWSKVEFIGPPQCGQCGYPFEHAMDGQGGEALCGACLADPPRFERARAVFRYGEDSRDMILGFKHRDRTEAAPAFAAWMARAGAELLDEADLIVPVPLHYWRLVGRRYNQAAMLALALARRSGKQAAPDLLLRTRATPPQQGLGAKARKRNVKGAFKVNPQHAGQVRGRRVLLVDDVYTTGATLDACTGALQRAGAAAVDVLTLARVVRPELL